MIIFPKKQNVSLRIPPNYSTWQTIELTNQCAKYVVDNNIHGCFVECGVATGNNLAAMCIEGRHGYGFDSFEGIPWAGENDTEQPGVGPKDVTKEGLLESSGITVHPMEQVRSKMEGWGVQNYTLIKGWFQDTVMHFHEEISVLRLDGDLYDSTMTCLMYLYPLLTKGGILIMDDWNLDGCRKAFDDYFKDSESPTLFLDDKLTYWVK